MSFDEISLERFVPDFLQSNTRDRIKTGLKDFFHSESNEREKNYTGFYAMGAPSYLMQSDVFASVKAIDWDYSTDNYVNCYFHSMLLSNTCDLSVENIRNTNIKQAVFAPMIPVEEVLKDMRQELKEEQTKSFYQALRRQEHSNLFYIPPNHVNGKDYIVFLDKTFWQPVTALKNITENVKTERVLSLSNWAFYLFLLKLSYHLCRQPEGPDERQN